jgi:glycosyltransferase involved in cell wall biosynthesis
MRVAHLSNIANVGYMNVKALRKLGVDAQLYYNPVDPYGISNPLWEDNELAAGSPEWIRPWRVKANLFNPFYHARFLREFRAFDILHAYTLSPIYALLTGVPYLAQTTGADITEVAQEKSVLGSLYRLALKKAQVVLFSNLNQIQDVRRLGIERARFIPFSIDTDKYSPKDSPRPGPGGVKTVFLHSSRLDWKSKGNDKFFRAFARFAAGHPGAVVYAPGAGPDVARTKALASELGITDKVIFLPKLTKDGILEYYRKADVVVDQFIIGGFGINALEAMSCAKPVLTYCDEKSCADCYGEVPPLLNARSEDDIARQLEKTLDMAYLADTGSRARAWVMKHHDTGVTADILIDVYRNVLGG